MSFHVKHEHLKSATTCQGGLGTRDMTSDPNRLFHQHTMVQSQKLLTESHQLAFYVTKVPVTDTKHRGQWHTWRRNPPDSLHVPASIPIGLYIHQSTVYRCISYWKQWIFSDSYWQLVSRAYGWRFSFRWPSWSCHLHRFTEFFSQGLTKSCWNSAACEPICGKKIRLCPSEKQKCILIT